MNRRLTYTRIRGEGFRLLPAHDLLSLAALSAFTWTITSGIHLIMHGAN